MDRAQTDMVELPGGLFLMGCEDFYPEERPAQEVEVGEFAIDRAPVTVAQFAKFVEQTGYVTLAERVPNAADYPEADPELLVPGSAVFQPTGGPVPLADPMRWWAYVPGASWRHPWGPRSDNSDRGDHPVTQVASEDAEAYAEWAGKQLPSEAEWEYAARGGLRGAVFAWGDEQRPGGKLMANHWQGQFPWRNTGAKGWRGTSPVRSFPANDFGLYDMTGNVWEWTADSFALRNGTTETVARPCCGPDPSFRAGALEPSHAAIGGHAAGAERRVVKGGSHLCAPNYCLRYRPAARQPETVDTSTSHIGFRCVIRAEGGD